MATRPTNAGKAAGKRINKSALARLAVEVRKELGVDEFERFDPYALADLYGVAVHPLDGLTAAGCPTASLLFYSVQRPEAWSAALVPDGTGQFIVENTAHQPARRRSNIAHEMAHVVLEHTFDRVLFTGDDRKGCVNPGDPLQEAEAAELGAELLVPKQAAIQAAYASRSDAYVAQRFDVSERLAAWRMNGTGARLMASRAAAKRARSSSH